MTNQNREQEGRRENTTGNQTNNAANRASASTDKDAERTGRSEEDADAEQGTEDTRSNTGVAGGKQEGLGEDEDSEMLRKDSKERQVGNTGNSNEVTPGSNQASKRP